MSREQQWRMTYMVIGMFIALIINDLWFGDC